MIRPYGAVDPGLLPAPDRFRHDALASTLTPGDDLRTRARAAGGFLLADRSAADLARTLPAVARLMRFGVWFRAGVGRDDAARCVEALEGLELPDLPHRLHQRRSVAEPGAPRLAVGVLYNPEGWTAYALPYDDDDDIPEPDPDFQRWHPTAPRPPR